MLDMVQAYHNSPIIPAHKKYLAVSWQNEIYVQHNAVKGLSSVGGIQGTPADACIEILHAYGISPVFKWVDDFVNFRSPSILPPQPDLHSFEYSLAAIFKITDPLGIPWHLILKKGQDFGPTFKYLSFIWNLPNCLVSLPIDRCAKVLQKVESLYLQNTAMCFSKRMCIPSWLSTTYCLCLLRCSHFSTGIIALPFQVSK